jgi:rhamnogalacturonan hydrolase
MSTWVLLKSGTAVSINLDGVIYRTGTAAGTMIFVEHTTDFEMYSSTSKGAVQGYGYVFHKAGTYGPRILRLYDVTNFSVHDLALVDSPAFHFSIDTCSNGEVYNMIVRGGNEGGLDGIDVWSTNIHIHDVEVTNKDECVTVKSPSKNILIENVFCNWSGGCAIGSLAAGTDISDIEYNHVYTQNSNQMLMIKSNGGSGTLKNVIFKNFMGHSNAHAIDLDSAWSSMSTVAGNGIDYSNITFDSWHGTVTNGASKPPVQVFCPAAIPCTGITISNNFMWTETGSKVLQKCSNAYGNGACLSAGASHTSYATITKTITSVASYAITTMPGEVTAGLGISTSIAIPAVPTTFFPGAKPAKALLGAS